MITYSILHRAEADRSTHYYGEQADDYYSRDGGAAMWHGTGAKRLGAVGEVDIKRFHAMLRGEFGKGVVAGRSIRKDSKARAGIDLTISAPKSITLQALVGGDGRLIDAHDQAVAYTLDYIEKHLTQARQKERGKTRSEQTTNLVIAKFRHETARPTPTAPPDPNLHTHAVIMNATQRADGSWAALSNEQIVGLRKLQDAVYMSRLDYLVKKLGYDVRYEKNHIELAHISRAHIEVFSKRSGQVETVLAARGLSRETSSHSQKQMLTLATRQQKTQNLTRDELHNNWTAQAREAGIHFSPELSATHRQIDSGPTQQRVADAALTWAIGHLSERETVMRRSDLLATAISHAEGVVSPDAIYDALARRLDQGQLLSNPTRYYSTADMQAEPRTRQSWAQEVSTLRGNDISAAWPVVDRAINEGRLVFAEPSYATTKALEQEQRIIALEKAGRDSLDPIMKPVQLTPMLNGTTLTSGQRDAVALMLTSRDQIIGIQGLAGTGKSFALQSTQRILNDHGYSMVALAPYGTQINDLRKDGIAANSVASFLTASEKRRFTETMGEKTVLVIDEAGAIPVRQMEKLLTRIQATGAKIVTLGDTAQTKAVEAGRAFALLQEHGMKTVIMGDIQRQKSERLRRAVELAATGHASQSLALVDQVACIPDTFTKDEHGHKLRDCSARYDTIAREYVALPNADQAETLIVTGTNVSRKAINNMIHERRGLTGKGHTFRLLIRHDTTKMQRRCAKYYTAGDIIQPERDYKCGLLRGELYRVVECERSADRIWVMPLNGDGTATSIEILPKTMSKLSVYHTHEAELSVGDRVRITRNNADLDLVNGQRCEVVAVTPQAVTLGIGDRQISLPADTPLHLDHAYATTAHSAQGMTCDRVFYNAESFSRTTAQDTYYVSISRERHAVTVFTDDVQALPKAVDRVPYKGLAHDLVGPARTGPTHKIRTQIQANEHAMEL
ncbi:MobF family relaxase [Allopusillimonas ginsengisoli]|uniref:MobF family relaxase n=1 Tax=Allopusillimonas ginsengisoli TaxID=453575 RepID=UPI0039C32A32